MNLPNKLSLARIILVPFMMFFYLATFIDPWGKFVAFAIFVIAAITDLFDGKIARKTGQVTDLGKLLDPIADKLLYSIGFALIVAYGVIPSPYGIIAFAILLFRDFMIDGIRQIAGSKGVVIPAAKSGKLKAVLHDIHIPMFIVLAGTKQFSGEFWNVFNEVLLILSLIVLALATIVTIYSAFDYFKRSKNLIFSDSENKEKINKEEKNKEDEK